MSLAWRERWRRLPRDSRDTLFLLAVIGWTLLPHASTLPAWCTALSGGVLAWRAVLAWRQAPLPPRAWLVGVLVLGLGLTYLSHGSLIGRDAGLTLLVVLAALKTLELRARRDAFVIFFLGFFLILTHFVHSQSLPVAVMMLLGVWGLLTGLVLAHMPVGQPALARAAGLAARTAALGLPVMLVLFLLFPRIAPLWGQPDETTGRVGLSNHLRLGDVSRLAQDDSIAMRVRFPAGREIDPRQLYFRGPVLGDFDGRQWLAVDTRWLAAVPLELRTTGEPLDYVATIEPLGLNTLPLLESTPALPELAGAPRGTLMHPTADLQWRVDPPLNDRVQVHGRAWTRFSHGPRVADASLQRYLLLPEGAAPRTRAWARGIRDNPALAQADARTLALALMQHIRGGNYTYTLEPGAYGEQAVDEFWLDRRRGFCEHYAASFVVVLRALGVPARIVTGYQGAERNPVDDTWIVRQRFAHAWVEYWQPGSGWLRADPTSAVSPERIERGRTLDPTPGPVLRALGGAAPGWLVGLRQRWDATQAAWNQWVLNYSRQEQEGLLKLLGFSEGDAITLGKLLAGLMGAAAAAVAGWALWEQSRKDPWVRAWQGVLRAARARGCPVGPATTPLALAEQLRQRWGPAAEPLCEELSRFSALHWGPAPARPMPPATLARALRRSLRALTSAGPDST